MAEVWLLPFLATALDRDECSSSYPGRFIPPTWKRRGKPHLGRKNVALLSDHRSTRKAEACISKSAVGNSADHWCSPVGSGEPDINHRNVAHFRKTWS